MGGTSSTPEYAEEEFATRGWPPMTNMDNVLQRINSQCISLSEDIQQRNNKILSDLVNTFVGKMKEQDALFNKLYNRIFYGGSYYDGLKVGKPDEYDLDLLMKFPKMLQYRLIQSNLPGFLLVEIDNPELLGDQFKRKFMQGNRLSADQLRRWMEGLVANVLKTFSYKGGYFQLSAGGYFLEGKMRKSGPAMTLLVKNTYEQISLDVDLVPCFEFNMNMLSCDNVWKVNPVPSKTTFFIVPKRPKNLENLHDVHWRLSFQEQERVLINDKRNLKPAIKLLKRLRDVCGHYCIASYYIKTIFLWTNEQQGANFWNGTLSEVFTKMLDVYIDYLDSGTITYFWNSSLNLLTVNPETIRNITNRLKHIRLDIEKNRATNPQMICKYLGELFSCIQ